MYGICDESTTIKQAWQAIGTENNGVTIIDISGVPNGDDIAYIRLTHIWDSDDSYPDDTSVKNGSRLIITVNEEIFQGDNYD